MQDASTANRSVVAGALAVGFCTTFAVAGNQWIDMTNETATRFLVAPSLGADDPEEKDYAWGDVNNNGWIDLVIVRKQPFSTPGRRVNLLMMNEGGVLVDRTQEYASAADVPGDMGFLTPTNDRYAVLADLLNNGWLDLTTATAYGNSLPKEISHPRIYRNLGASGSGGGQWQGFRYEASRIPQLAAAPHALQVAAGDVTENGYADLFFVTYSAGTSFPNVTKDFLLINSGDAGGPPGPGYFTDQTSSRLPTAFWSHGSFGSAARIVDLTGNNRGDIIKGQAGGVHAVYNLGGGFFGANNALAAGGTYVMNVGDLNNNGRIDLVIVDDGQDRYRLNLDTNAQGQVVWASAMMLPESSNGSGFPSSNFGGNPYVIDLNNDGYNDIVIADVDAEQPGCTRHSNIYRNNANPPNVTFAWNPGTIPTSMLKGVFAFAVLDISGNGWTDIVVGRCTGTQVWINNPPFSLEFKYPDGWPGVVEPGVQTTVLVQLVAHGGSVTPGSAQIHTSVNGGPWQQTMLTAIGGDVYQGALPAVDCLDEIEWYVSAQMSDSTFTDPPGPPNPPDDRFSVIAAEVVVAINDHDFNADDGGFTVVNDPSLTHGAWSHGTPTGSNFFGQIAAPFGDASDSGGGKAWVTCLGGTAGTCNVNFGPTHLISSAFDLSEGPAQIVYDRWMFCHNANLPERVDFLKTYVSSDGGAPGSWVFVHQTSGTNNTWETASFVVSDFVALTDNVRVRFTIEDEDADSITNAGVDNLRVEAFVCDDPAPGNCPADLTGDGSVGVSDLLDLLAAWGPNPGHAADLTGDGSVGVSDLLQLLAA